MPASLSAIPEVIHTEGTKPEPVEDVWSYSRLATFDRCEREFFYKYRDHRPTPANMPMIMGKVFASAMEWIIKEGYELEEAVRFAIYEAGGLPEGENLTTILNMVHNAVYRIPVGVEVQSEVHLVLVTTLGKVQGYIDLLLDDPASDRIEIWDFKSGWKYQEASESLQLGLYAWILSELRGTALGGEFVGRIIMPRINGETEVELTSAVVEGAKNWFIRTVHKIKEKPLDRNEWSITKEKRNCETCPFVGLCASDIHELGFPGNGEVTTIEDATVMGEYILMQEAFIKSLKKGLKTYVENNESVAVGKKSWHIQSSTPKPKVEDMAELMSFAIENGLDVTKAVSSDPTKIQDWLDQDDTGKLEQLVQWTRITKTLKYG